MAVEEAIFFALEKRVLAVEQALLNPASTPVATGGEGQPASDVFDVVNSLTSQVTDFAARLTALEEAVAKAAVKP